MSARRSLAWAYSGQITNFAIQFAGSVVVARLLSPHEIGIYAIAMAALGVVAVFTAFGVGSFVVREPDLQPHTLSTAFTVNTMLICSLSIILVLLSFAAGPLLGEPRAGFVLQIVAVSNLFGIVTFRPSTMFQREMQFKRISLIGVISGLSQTGLTIVFALLGFSYLSPAYAGLITGAVTATMTLALGRSHAGYRLSLIGLRPMITFGLQLMSVGGVAVLVGRLSDLILGRVLGVAALGLYGRASSLSGMIFDNVYGTATRVVFVQLSKDLRETDDLRPTFVKSLRIIIAIMWPLLIGLAILSRPFIYILYGQKWMGAAVPLSFLLIAQVLALSFGMNWELFVLRGETGRQAKYEITRSLVGIVLFSIGCTIGLAAAAASRVVDSLLGLILYFPHVRRLARTAPNELPRVYLNCAWLTVLAVTPSLALMVWHGWAADVPLWQIIPVVTLGIALWAAGIVQSRHPIRDEAAILLRRIARGGSAGSQASL